MAEDEKVGWVGERKKCYFGLISGGKIYFLICFESSDKIGIVVFDKNDLYLVLNKKYFFFLDFLRNVNSDIQHSEEEADILTSKV